MRYSDIHGDADREAVVVLGRTRGGVPWSGSVVAYNAKGEPVWSFNGSEVGGDPRSGVTFLEATDTSVTFDIIGTGKDSGGALQSGNSDFNLAKGADGKPALSLVSHTD